MSTDYGITNIYDANLFSLSEEDIKNYWCPVNTDNSLFDGLLYSYKPPYRYSTPKNENFYV